MSEEKTITEGLNIPENFCEIAEEIISENLRNNQTIHQCILDSIERIREDEFGKCDADISPYEKKLFFAGFVLGIRTIQNGLENAKKAAFQNLMEDLLSRFKGPEDTEKS
jgi:hypothetical protein